MKLRLTFVVIFLGSFLLPCISPLAEDGADDESAIYTGVEWKGKTYEIKITSSALKASPAWDPAKKTEPPLSITKAIVVANEYVKKNFPEAKDWPVTSIDLRRCELPEISNRWYYIITKEPKQDWIDVPSKQPYEHRSITITVLFNQKVVPPGKRID